MEFIRVGNIINTFGIKGELKVDSITDFPEERYKENKTLYILFVGKYVPVTVKSYRVHKGFVLLLLKNLENINLVEKYKGCELLVSKEDLHTLKDGEFYFFELENLDVYNRDEFIGKVVAIEYGYQTILRVKNGTKEVLIPYVGRFIKSVDKENNRINVDLIEGML